MLGSIDLWPYLYAITLIPSVVHFFFLPFCVETPKYLFINRNIPIEAEKGKIIRTIVKPYNAKTQTGRL